MGITALLAGLCRRETRSRPAKRPAVTRLAVEQLEDRLMPAVNLTVGANVNISQQPGNQAEGTIAINPMDGMHMFAASVQGEKQRGHPLLFLRNNGDILYCS